VTPEQIDHLANLRATSRRHEEDNWLRLVGFGLCCFVAFTALFLIYAVSTVDTYCPAPNTGTAATTTVQAHCS
jgi:hypothetical protein